MADFPSLLADPRTRQRALETLLVAHLIIDPRCLDGRKRPGLTPSADALVDMVRSEKVHRCLLVHVLLSLRVIRHVTKCDRASPLGEPRYAHLLRCTRRARYRDVVRMAQHAERLTVDELSFLTRETVLTWLGAVVIPKKSKADRILELAEGAAA